MARSMAFIASGRANVMVATPSATLLSTADPVMDSTVVPPTSESGRRARRLTRLCRTFTGTE